MPLSETSRRVWRAVAARGRTGVGSAQVHDHFKSQIDSLPLSATLSSLQRSGYLRSNDNGKFSTWWATDRVPLGEDRPVWLDELEADHEAQVDTAAQADAVVAAAKASGTPAWPFGSLPATKAADVQTASAAARQAGVNIDRAHAPAQPSAPPKAISPSPWFAIDSNGQLSLRADGIEGRLSAESTRALFAWLDRLALSALAQTVEAQS